jgi:transposase-like protein
MIESMGHAGKKKSGLSLARSEEPSERSGGERSETTRSVEGSSERIAAPDPEVPAIAKRRRFTAEFKARILREVEACRAPGEIGVLLRREGLYSSHLVIWRKAHAAGELKPGAAKRRGPKPDPVRAERREIDRLGRENARLQRRLERAEAIIEVQRKLSALLNIPLNPDSAGMNE